jgi:aminopeptidase N
MKKIYCFLFLYLFITALCFAQQPGNPMQRTMQIAASEKRGITRQHFLEKLSNASGNFDINFYRCEWDIDPAVKYINGKITSYFTITAETNSISFDLTKTLTVDSIRYHGSNITFLQKADNTLQVQFPSLMSTNQKDSVTVFYQGIPDNGGLGSFTQSQHSGTPVIWTLSEPYGAKDWWPCKNGLDDKADSIDVVISTPAIYRGVSNGVLASEWTSGGQRFCYYKHRFPIASYLVCMAATNFAIYQDSVLIGGRQMPFISYTYPENYSVFQSEEATTKKALEVLSKLFGDYPFAKEKYGHTQFGWGGGMEHQTNSFIYWPYPWLTPHELGHQWFGDKVTPRTWVDLWLNEGFATYSVLLFNEYYFDPGGEISAELISLRDNITSEPGGSVKVTDTSDINRLFDGRLTYNKGCYLLHMLRWKLGDSAFFKGVRRYLNDPAVSFGYATTPDLQRNLEQESGQSLTGFFKEWYEGEGYPNYQANWKQNTNNWAMVQINQVTSDPSVSFYEMPLPLQFKNATRDTTIVVNHQQSGQVFWINVGFAADTMIIDPKLWILAKNKTTQKIAGNTITDNIKIYPNPAPGNIYVLLQNPAGTQLQLHLFNSLGQLTYRQQIGLSGRDELITIPAAGFAKGVYWLQVSDDKHLKVVKKIVK